jgi:uncharacterized membrane protein (DUF373 family)
MPGPPAPEPVDDEGLPVPPPAQGKAARRLLQILVEGEKLTFMAIAVALLALALVVFARGVQDLVLAPAGEQFAVTITRAVNSVLFIVVLLELVRTIVARLEGGGFQLQPFLVIGIISATRDILTVGAELSLVGEQAQLGHTLTELGVNAGVVVALSVALVLIRRFARLNRLLRIPSVNDRSHRVASGGPSRKERELLVNGIPGRSQIAWWGASAGEPAVTPEKKDHQMQSGGTGTEAPR